MNHSLKSRLTIIISIFIVLTLSFFVMLTVINSRLQFNALSTVIVQSNNQTFEPLEEPFIENEFFIAESIQGAKLNFNRVIVATAVIFIVFSIIIAYCVSGKALKPLEQFKHDLQMRDINTINRPFQQHGRVPQEIVALQTSFEMMSKRVSDSFDQQKRFTDNAAHELKTPIATMKTGLQLLQMEGRELSEAEFEDVLNRMILQLNRFNATIEDLETLSLHERSELSKEVLFVDELIDQIILENQAEIQSKKLTIHKKAKALELFAQKNLFCHAISNIFQNAVKYADFEGRIEISWENKGDYFNIYVKNTGKPIPKADQELIFRPFYRVDDSRSRMTGGSGLGLSIVYEIMKRHNGEAKLVSSADNLTIFQLKFPIE